jgi:hypothetical protein
MKQKIFALTLISAFIFQSSNAIGLNTLTAYLLQKGGTKTDKKFVTEAEEDGLIFSLLRGTNGAPNSNIRFSSFLNSGVRFHYKVNNSVSVFSGVNLKNVGYASRLPLLVSTQVARNRNYYAGIPLGLTFGKLEEKTTFSLGGGLDVTVHHKEKYWEEGNKGKSKQKVNCNWFSDKNTNLLNGYVFASGKVKGIGLKLQYYFTEYAAYGGNLMYASLIFDPKFDISSK